MADGPHTHRRQSGKIYRGSRKRVERIRWRGNNSPEMWIFVILLVFLLTVVVPWMMNHTGH